MKTVFEPPYRLETEKEIERAGRENLLSLGSSYQRMLSFARDHKIVKPQALVQAKSSATTHILTVREEKTKLCDITWKQPTLLESLKHFEKIQQSLPWIGEIVSRETLYVFLQEVWDEVRQACYPKGAIDLSSAMLLRKLLRREILYYVQAKKMRHMSIEQLKMLIAAYALFLPENEDVLQALRLSRQDGARQPLGQHAAAELLFARIPGLIRELAFIDIAAIRRKLFAKISRLPLTNRQRSNLFACFKPDGSDQSLSAILDKTAKMSGKLLIEAGTLAKLQDYIRTLKSSIVSVGELCRGWFFPGELEAMRQLHVPCVLLEQKMSYREAVLKKHTIERVLSFYPTKDYLDLEKGWFSGDCTCRDELGREQLLTPNFFNVRMFSGSEWIGNIYMLDFTETHRLLLVDRIQMPRNFKVYFVDFFDRMLKAFSELFSEVPYECILLPLRISNHGSVQTAFNMYKKELKKREFHFDVPYAGSFESLEGKSRRYVCIERNTIQVQRAASIKKKGAKKMIVNAGINPETAT